uniref:mediator of DNA damage checkpoint protein 1 isoform X2 n=1 Tax=Scatophagus argus TaxID=75038 RepID=UPI001ED83020|nr:mediator of DNA damage checkpoint protein 1 isoform X2 [Scatophagus argus]
MDATQMISDSILESDEEENEEENESERGRPLAKLCILKNEHVPETELPLFSGENVLGRDPNTCALVLSSPSISKRHATICISVYRRRGSHTEVDIEALVWDLGSMNGTRKGRLRLTPNVRYALSECDRLVVADIPCQYVSCAAGTVSSQGNLRTPVSRNSEVKARLPDALGEKGSDTSTGSKKCVGGGAKTRVSLPELEGTSKTPVRTSCLSFEQTPTQPQKTLVPESDSDSDAERGGGAATRRRAVVSDSDSSKSSPMPCSTFLSPTNKIVPESEDESPITPSISAKNRPHRHVSFSKEETDVDVGRQQLKEKKAFVIVDNSKEPERAVLGEGKSEESGQDVSVKQESNVSLKREDELPVSTPAVFTYAVPAFDMDSDTDMEGEEEGVAPAVPITLNTSQQLDQPSNIAEFHMDSDTDVDEDDEALDKILKSVPYSADNAKPPHVIHPESITMDSDTDVDDDTAVSDAASKAKLLSFQNTHTADATSSTQLKDFHLDSDTDVDEEEEKEFGTINTGSKIDETPTRLDIKPTGPESDPATPHGLNLGSDTDDEAIPAPAISEPSVVSAVTESCTTADTAAHLNILADSDADVKCDSPLVIPVVVTTLSFAPGTASEALQSDSDQDTDVDESSVPPERDRGNPDDLHVSSDTDVEDEEVNFGGTCEGQTPSLHRENTPGLPVPHLQNCSTPVQLSEGEVEHMETQTFLSPSSGPFRRGLASPLKPMALSSCSDSQEDEEFVVAETQSFVLQTRDNPSENHSMHTTQTFGQSNGGEQSSRRGSFQLGLSDSSHLQGQAQALAMESTQAFVSVEDTQAYAAISDADRTSSENDSNLEAAQSYGENEEPARCSVMSEKEEVDLALEATQAYISEPNCDSEEESEDESKNTDSPEPLDFPTSSTLAMAETQPISAFVEGECLGKENPITSALRVQLRPQNETEEQEHREADQPQQRPLDDALSVAETQPIRASDDEESDDEDDSVHGPRKRKAKPLQFEEEETQRLTNSDLSVVETQPMDTGEDRESDDEDDPVPGPRKRKAKPLQLEEEQTQPLTSSELSLVETQPMHIGVDETQSLATSGNEDSDKEDSIPGSRKRKAKQLHFEDETQPLANSELSAVETQPVDAGKDGGSDEEDSVPGPRKRKAKQLQIEEEQTQSLTSSDVAAVETQPVDTGEDGESHEEDSVPGPRQRKARPLQIQEEETQPLTNSEASTNETQPLTTKTVLQPERGKEVQSEAGTSGITVRGKRGTRASLEEEELAECSAAPKSQTRGKNKTLQTTRGRRGKSRLDEDESEEEKKVKQAKLNKGKKATKQQKGDEDDEEMERNLHAESVSLMKEQEEGRLGEKEGVTEVQQQEEEKKEKERREICEREGKQRESQREEEEKSERERKEKEVENAERLRLERERERKEKEEKEKAERMLKDKEEQFERERKERQGKGKLEHEKAEREEKERLEREENAIIENHRKEQEEKERLEREEKERKERDKLEKEKQEKEANEQQENKEEQNKSKAPARGRRAARRTTELEQDSATSTNDDVPARRTRSRSNSSNSVSSERSASSVNTQESRGRGRGRGRGGKRTSEPPRAAIARSSDRRRTVAAELTEQDSNDISPRGALSRSYSNNSLNSDIASCSLSSRSRGRGGRQCERGRKTEVDSVPPINSQNDPNSAPNPTPRGRKSRKAEVISNNVPQEDDKEKTDSQQAITTRGRRRANANVLEPAGADKDDPSNQEEECANEESLMSKRNVRGRGQKAIKSETVEAPLAPVVSHVDESKEERRGRKRELGANTEEDSCSSSKIYKGTKQAQAAEPEEDEAKGETKYQIPAPAKRKGRTSSAQAKKNGRDCPTEVEAKKANEKMEGEAIEKRGRSRLSVIQKKKKEEQEESGTSADQDAHVEASQTPTSSVSRKRQSPADSSPVAKTPRPSAASPAASGRFRAVLFTGVVDEAGEKVLARLGGSMAKGVADMNCLVTDKVRRTVKFLCAVAKGIPIVTTHWLEKSGKAGSFLSPNAFIVKDPEQEKKFNFCLQTSLRIGSTQPLFQGYGIHVTRSVKPEPVQMKDIITCSGATFLAKMPSSSKPQTVVISCEEDWQLCGPALSASLPVVTAEFILTGILQQKLDFQTHALSAPQRNLQPTGGRGRDRKKT